MSQDGDAYGNPVTFNKCCLSHVWYQRWSCPLLERCTHPCLCGHHTTWMYLTTHAYVYTLHIHVHSMCRVHIGACVVGNWTATCNGTKILMKGSVAHTGQRCLHTTLLCPCHMLQSRRPGPRGPWLTYPQHSQFVMCGYKS